MRSWRATALLAAASLIGCGAIIGVDERHAGPPAEEDASTPDSADRDASHPSPATQDAATPPQANAPSSEALGAFVDPYGLSLSATHIAIADVTGRPTGRNKIVVYDKADPSAPKTVLDEPYASSSVVSSLELVKDKLWYATKSGVSRMQLDGTNPTSVSTSPAEIIAASAGAVWLASPDALSNAPTLRWHTSDLLAQLPESSLALGNPAVFARATNDDELAFLTRGAGGAWSLSRWRPFASTPLTSIATFEAYPSWVAFDAARAFVYSEDEGSILAYDRATGGTPTVVLANVPAGKRAIASDGKYLVLRSETAVSQCEIASCAATLAKLPTTAQFTKTRGLVLDATHVYFLHALGDGGPMTLSRVRRFP